MTLFCLKCCWFVLTRCFSKTELAAISLCSCVITCLKGFSMPWISDLFASSIWCLCLDYRISKARWSVFYNSNTHTLTQLNKKTIKQPIKYTFRKCVLNAMTAPNPTQYTINNKHMVKNQHRHCFGICPKWIICVGPLPDYPLPLYIYIYTCIYMWIYTYIFTYSLLAIL